MYGYWAINKVYFNFQKKIILQVQNNYSKTSKTDNLFVLQFHPTDFIPRDCESHSTVLQLIQEDRSGASSTTYGINASSLFMFLEGFDVTPFVHTVFEGVAKRHLGYLLNLMYHFRYGY